MIYSDYLWWYAMAFSNRHSSAEAPSFWFWTQESRELQESQEAKSDFIPDEFLFWEGVLSVLIISKAGLHFAWSFVCIDKLMKLIMGLPSDPVTVFDVRPAWRCLRIGSTVAPLHLRGFTVLRALQSPGWSHLWKVPCFGQPQLASAYNYGRKELMEISSSISRC